MTFSWPGTSSTKKPSKTEYKIKRKSCSKNSPISNKKSKKEIVSGSSKYKAKRTSKTFGTQDSNPSKKTKRWKWILNSKSKRKSSNDSKNSKQIKKIFWNKLEKLSKSKAN